MIFSELYSAYYNAVSRIIGAILQGERDEKQFRAIVEECAFGESMLSIMPSLKSGKWQLVRPDMTTPLHNIPELPITELEKRWLKAISLDSRVRLFGASFDWLRDVEPLFTPEDYLVYDKYGDGDPYTDEGYIERFQFILKAIKSKSAVVFETLNRNGERVRIAGVPEHLEYSEKDDKFRVIMLGKRQFNTLNLGRILSARAYMGGEFRAIESCPQQKRELVILVEDQRNALERVMLHFAHFEKKAERIDKLNYRLRISYDPSDETEMVIRVLSFGPMVRVEAPDDFVKLIRARLKKQMLLTNNISKKNGDWFAVLF